MTREQVVGSLPGFIAPILVYLGIITANRMQRGTQREVQVITDLSARLEKAEQRVEKAEQRQDEAENRERMLQDYVHALRDHISKGQPPPPPPWPEGLHT